MKKTTAAIDKLQDEYNKLLTCTKTDILHAISTLKMAHLQTDKAKQLLEAILLLQEESKIDQRFCGTKKSKTDYDFHQFLRHAPDEIDEILKQLKTLISSFKGKKKRRKKGYSLTHITNLFEKD